MSEIGHRGYNCTKDGCSLGSGHDGPHGSLAKIGAGSSASDAATRDSGALRTVPGPNNVHAPFTKEDAEKLVAYIDGLA